MTASRSGPGLAGGVLALTCYSTCNRLARLSWESDSAPVTGGVGISVHQDQESPNTVKSVLIFYPLRTSHAGDYTCVSDVENGFAIKRSTTHVHVQSESMMLE